MIITITGASGVGKTSTIKALAKNLPAQTKIKFFHIDELIQPNWDEIEDTQKWQEAITLELITKVIDTVKQENTHAIFEGSTAIKYYLQAFEKNNYADFKIILFDCSQETMQARLAKRGQPELYTQDMINWLHYLRREAVAKGVKIISTNEATQADIGKEVLREFDLNLP